MGSPTEDCHHADGRRLEPSPVLGKDKDSEWDHVQRVERLSLMLDHRIQAASSLAGLPRQKSPKRSVASFRKSACVSGPCRINHEKEARKRNETPGIFYRVSSVQELFQQEISNVFSCSHDYRYVVEWRLHDCAPRQDQLRCILRVKLGGVVRCGYF